MTESTSSWHRTSNGTYVMLATCDVLPFTTKSWHIWKRSSRDWAIESVTTLRRSCTNSESLPPVSVDLIRHGNSHTLREAKSFCERAEVIAQHWARQEAAGQPLTLLFSSDIEGKAASE